MNRFIRIPAVIFCFIISTAVFSQHAVMNSDDADKAGLSDNALAATYKQAVFPDTAKAVFKTREQQIAAETAFVVLNNDLNAYLKKNGFVLEKPVSCYSRIYFSADGSIDYFIYSFLSRNAPSVTQEQEKEFARLVNAFIQTYKIQLTATEKFMTYRPLNFRPE